ncbi:MAG: hypothetical protein Q8R79_02145 [Legionellaceae bacterium]|nr:hypothetical protein [Legionellaceae bacterium]
MIKKKSIGLLLRESDLAKFSKNSVDLILIPPGTPISETDVTRITEIPAYNLNRSMPLSAISSISKKLAPHIRNFINSFSNLPIVAIATQNDVYQYHLRLQYYFLVSLECFLKTLNEPFEVVIPCRPYPFYWSPMRPEQKLLHSIPRLYAYLAIRLIEDCGGKVIYKGHIFPTYRILNLKSFYFRAVLRKVGVTSVRYYQLVKKILKATQVLNRISNPEEKSCIGVIVRTDSEVISASFLIAELKSHDIDFVIIHDELISSQTTKSRLKLCKLSFISIGSMHGILGFLKALYMAPRKIRYSQFSPLKSKTKADEILLSSEQVWKSMSKRLLDFSVDQTHFAIELTTIIKKHKLSKLITFAYVDQWGRVIQKIGANFGIPTIAVQNAVQDPEEYPCLDWSDHYCVESQWLKRKLIEMGYCQGRITATGLPHFISKYPKELPLWNDRFNKKTLIILTQPIYQSYFQSIIAMAGDICTNLHLDLIIKLHPRQNGNPYIKTINQLNKSIRLRICKEESLDSLLNASSFAISVVSASLIRAIFLGVPTFSLLPIEEQYLNLPYMEHSVVSVSSSIQELRDSIMFFINNFEESYKQYGNYRKDYLLKHAVFEPTDNSQKNIINVILNTELRGK